MPCDGGWKALNWEPPAELGNEFCIRAEVLFLQGHPNQENCLVRKLPNTVKLFIKRCKGEIAGVATDLL